MTQMRTPSQSELDCLRILWRKAGIGPDQAAWASCEAQGWADADGITPAGIAVLEEHGGRGTSSPPRRPIGRR